MPFIVFLAVFAFTMPMAGTPLDKYGPRKLVVIGGHTRGSGLDTGKPGHIHGDARINLRGDRRSGCGDSIQLSDRRCGKMVPRKEGTGGGHYRPWFRPLPAHNRAHSQLPHSIRWSVGRPLDHGACIPCHTGPSCIAPRFPTGRMVPSRFCSRFLYLKR